MKALERLSLPGKFVLLGLLALALIAAPTALYVGSAERLASTAGELSAVTSEATHGLHRQSGELDQAATAVTELTSAIEEVARNALSASEVSQAANQRSRQGQESVTRTVDAIESLTGEIEHTAGALQSLAGQIGDIGSVLDVIRGIAEQTNLLALNAAIEAARTGELNGMVKHFIV